MHAFPAARSPAFCPPIAAFPVFSARGTAVAFRVSRLVIARNTHEAFPSECRRLTVKKLVSLALLTFVSLAWTPLAWSQSDTADPQQDRDRAQDCTNFVDEDGDGICDNCGGSESDGVHQRDQDRDQDRTQDCDEFVDEDGDGICDNCGRTHDGAQDRTEEREQNRDQDCDAFIDEDGDGVCDLCGGDHAGAPDGEQTQRRFRRGDVNQDGDQNLTDAVEILNGLFRGRHLGCPDAADVNDDGETDVSDCIRLLVHLFRGGAEDCPAPFRHAGDDPTPDGLGCE